jgi:hypothetical protein
VLGYVLTPEEVKSLGPAPRPLQVARVISQAINLVGPQTPSAAPSATPAAASAEVKTHAKNEDKSVAPVVAPEPSSASSGRLQLSFEKGLPSVLRFDTALAAGAGEAKQSTNIEFGQEQGRTHLIVPPNSRLVLENLNQFVAPNGNGRRVNRYTVMFECKVWTAAIHGTRFL